MKSVLLGFRRGLLIAFIVMFSSLVFAEELTLQGLKLEMEKMRADHGKEVAELKDQIKQLQQERGCRGPGETAKSDKDAVELFGDEGLVKAGGFRLGAYGEHKWIFPDDANSSFDPHRIVLLPSYAFNEWIVFNAEIEFEHGGVDDTDGSQPTNTSRFSGEVEVEQAWIDFKFNEHFNWRSLGIDLIPVGRINPYHEPVTFYSTERPEIYNNLIPSTWMENGTSVYGMVTDGLKYQVMVSQGLVDGNVAGLGPTGTAGIRGARPGMRNDRSSSLGYTARLEYAPGFIPGLNGSASIHYSPDIQNAASNARGSTDIALFNSEFVYRIPKTGWELRADGVFIDIGNSGGLFANNDGVANNGVGRNMWGVSGEAAYHFTPWKDGRLKNADVVPFFRYSKIDLQSGFIPFDTAASPANGQGDQQFWIFGVAFLPIPDVVLKLDYRIRKTEQTANSYSDQAELAVGYVF